MALSNICKCELTLGAFGTPNCQSIMDVTKRLIFAPENKLSDGTKNQIDLTGSVYTQLMAQLTAGDILPTGEIKNIEDVRGDSTFQSFNDGSNLFVRQGVRKFTGYFPAVNSSIVKEFESIRGQKMGVYFVDKNGNLVGKTKDFTNLVPVSIDTNTFEAKLVKATDSEVQMIMITFEFKSFEKDGDLALIKADDIVNISLLDESEFKSPYRAYFENLIATQTTLTFDLVHYSGSALACPIVGIDDLGLISVKNVTTNADLILTGIAENSDGNYTVTFASQTTGNKLDVDFVADPTTLMIKTDSVQATI